MQEEKNLDDADLQELQEELEKLEKKEGGSSTLPTSPKYDMAQFFRDAATRKDTTRISKLSKQLIGEPRNSEMGLRRIALYAQAENLGVVAKYFIDQANLIPELYMSKDGFFLQSAVTTIQKKTPTKTSSPRTGWFNKRKPEGEE